MRKLWFLLLAVCLIGFLAGCDGGGGGGSSNDNGGSNGGSNTGTMIFKVTDLVNRAAVTGFTSNSGTIHYVDNESKTHDDTVTLTVNLDDNTFSLYQKEVCSDPLYSCDLTYYGTYEVSGNTVNVHCNKSKDTGTGTETQQDWDDTFTFSTENNTVNIFDYWVLTQQ
ncbi:MAG: hypothetical protein J6W62_02425 [Spirochaetia bacterium]|nr:hypothetical protein [Spirochaetia bacterium]